MVRDLFYLCHCLSLSLKAGMKMRENEKRVSIAMLFKRGLCMNAYTLIHLCNDVGHLITERAMFIYIIKCDISELCWGLGMGSTMLFLVEPGEM